MTVYRLREGVVAAHATAPQRATNAVTLRSIDDLAAAELPMVRLVTI